MTTGWIGIEIATDETKLRDATHQFINAIVRAPAGRLRKLANTNKIIRKQAADAMNEIIAVAAPGSADVAISKVVAHCGRLRREDGQVDAALSLDSKLSGFDAFADFIVAYKRIGRDILSGSE